MSIKIVLTGKNQGITTLISFRIDQAFKGVLHLDDAPRDSYSPQSMDCGFFWL